MRKILWPRSLPEGVIVLGSSLVFASTTLAATGVPELLFHDAFPEYPIWVSAESALKLDGQPDEALFDEGYRNSIAQLISSAKEGECVQLMASISEPVSVNGAAASRATLSSALLTTDWVFLGKVVDRSSGFRGGQAGTMMEVEPVESLKGTGTGFESHFIYHPAARFNLGSTEICRTAWQYAKLPQLGDEVLVLVNLWSRNTGRLLWVGEDSGMISFESGGGISFPWVYIEADPEIEELRADEFLRWARAIW